MYGGDPGQCAHCGKMPGEHQEKTKACPVGQKVQGKYPAYSRQTTYVKKPAGTL